jgi:prephenate dehydrogenase
MTKPRVTIIGLGFVGGSIGLALAASGRALHIIGHDIDPGLGRLAKKMGAVNESKINLIDACEEADLVILATPVSAIRETLELIAPHLKQGCAVTDTATIKGPVLEWAAEALPESVSFVGGDPVLRTAPTSTQSNPSHGLEAARADLLKDALYFLCTTPNTPPTAVKRVSDLAMLLQAQPVFMDPVEHDGIRAAVEGLPTLLSLALMKEVGDAPSWQEARKLADQVFGTATAPLADEAQEKRTQLILNAPYLLPRLDTFIEELMRLRQWIAEEDSEALDKAFEQAQVQRFRWLREWEKGDWEEEIADLGVSGTFGALKNAFGFGLRGKKREEE